MGHLVAGFSRVFAGGGGVPGVSSTIIFADSCEHMTGVSQKWTATTGGTVGVANSETGAHGRCYDNATARESIAISPALVTASAGMRFKVTTDTTDAILRFQDTSSTNQISVLHVAGGAFRVARGNTPTTLATSTSGLISTGTWYYIEASVTIDNSAGAYTVKLYDDSGTLLETLTASGVDTQQTANAFTNRLDIGGVNANTFTDNLWLDNTGALYGPLRIEALYPTGNGTTNQFSRGGADSGSNVGQVDEAQNNDATDYLTTTDDGEIELFTFPARSLAGAIHAVQVTAVMRRSAANSPTTARMVCRLGGVNYFGASLTMDDTWDAFVYSFGENPATTAAWDSSELSGAEFGVEATQTAASVEVTQVVVELVTGL